MALLSVMLDRVHDTLPVVPEALALRALSDSVKEFCKRTHIWQEAMPAVRTKADRTRFELAPETGTMVVALKDVRMDGQRVPPVAGELPRILTTRLPAAARPAAWTQVGPKEIQLLNATTDAEQLTIRAALTLVQGYTTYNLPDAIVDEYAEPIAAGAKTRLLMQANSAWYAPDAAVPYRNDFYRAVNEAKRRTMTALGEADLSVEMRSW